MQLFVMRSLVPNQVYQTMDWYESNCLVLSFTISFPLVNSPFSILTTACIKSYHVKEVRYTVKNWENEVDCRELDLKWFFGNTGFRYRIPKNRYGINMKRIYTVIFGIPIFGRQNSSAWYWYENFHTVFFGTVCQKKLL